MSIERSAVEHYNAEYFAWQSEYGPVGGLANEFKFSPYVKPDDVVLDFGCGGGFLLQVLNAKRKIGVEINPVAREEAGRRGIEVHGSLADVASGTVDTVISNHALEHVEDPMSTVREFRRVLKPGGVAVIVTPYDTAGEPFRLDDRDFHLFGWSPANLGNLMRAAGFNVLEVAEIKHRWPPKWNVILDRFGISVFHLVCRAYARLRGGRTQIRVVCRSE